jgi:hypothetical protein
MMVLTWDLANEAALMDTLLRAAVLRNTAAGQSPDETRHVGFAPTGITVSDGFTVRLLLAFLVRYLSNCRIYRTMLGSVHCSGLTYRRGHLCPILEPRYS